MNITASIVMPDNRAADVLAIDFYVTSGVFKVQAQLWVPGSDGSAPRMVGRYRVRTGSGRELDAAMRDCAENLLKADR